MLKEKLDTEIFGFKPAFTVVELVAALVVISLIILVTLPVTMKKLKKVDYASYYMGYDAVTNVAKEAFPAILKLIKDEEDAQNATCTLELLDGTCFTSQVFKPSPISKTVCNDLASQDYGNNPAYCNSDSDYWAGAVEYCGGTKKLPSADQLKYLFVYLYTLEGAEDYIFDPSMSYPDVITGLHLKQENLAAIGVESVSAEGFSLWSATEGADVIPIRRFYNDSTKVDSAYRYDSSISGICVKPEPEDTDYVEKFCNEIKDVFNVESSNCSMSAATVAAGAASADFSGINPHIVFSNGLMLYFGSNYGNISALSDAEDENDRLGFVIYVDVNGKSNKGILYRDVFPFYLLRSGKIIPAYDNTVLSGANNPDNLSVNVLYDTYSSGNVREVKFLKNRVSFQEGACASGFIKSTKYCDSFTKDSVCDNSDADCRFDIRKPVKIF